MFDVSPYPSKQTFEFLMMIYHNLFTRHCPSCPCEGHYGCDYCKYCTYCTLCGLCDTFCEDGKLIGAMGTMLEYSTRLLGYEPDVNYNAIDEDIQKGVEKAKKHKEEKQKQQQVHESHDEL
jgi:hypothetical protein